MRGTSAETCGGARGCRPRFHNETPGTRLRSRQNPRPVVLVSSRSGCGARPPAGGPGQAVLEAAQMFSPASTAFLSMADSSSAENAVRPAAAGFSSSWATLLAPMRPRPASSQPGPAWRPRQQPRPPDQRGDHRNSQRHHRHRRRTPPRRPCGQGRALQPDRPPPDLQPGPENSNRPSRSRADMYERVVSEERVDPLPPNCFVSRSAEIDL
jgi:hypothetical protein